MKFESNQRELHYCNPKEQEGLKICSIQTIHSVTPAHPLSHNVRIHDCS